MLTCIRNAVAAERAVVEFPTSKLRVAIADALQRHGYIWDFAVVAAEGDESKRRLRINLKYGPTGERVIQHIKRVSSPGRRIYRKCAELRPILNGMGITIISTSHGVVSDREARQKNLGGEVLCEVW